MQIALTGATGFLGRYLLRQFVGEGHRVRCWRRPASVVAGLEDLEASTEWVAGDLGDADSARELVEGCDAVVHAALDRPGAGFRGAEGDLVAFVDRNVVGTLRLIEHARAAGAGRFVFISTCAVHERILPDRPLDETHPTTPTSHYGAHKAAVEQFVHSFGWGTGYPICSLRPTGIYGVAHPVRDSKWFDLVEQVVRGGSVECVRGGKEVHAADVARAASLLLSAPADQIAGESFNCYDRYVSEWDVAHIAKEISGGGGTIGGRQTAPKNQIVTDKLRGLGMQFGGEPLLRETVQRLASAVG